MSRNSVLEEFSVRRFEVIQEEIVKVESEERKERAECHLCRDDGLGN